MIVELPINVKIDGQEFDRVEIKKPRGGTMSQVFDFVNSKGYLYAIQPLLENTIESFINDSIEIKNKQKTAKAVSDMYWVNVEALVIKLMAYMNGGFVQGLYQCSFCGNDITIRESEGNSIAYMDLIVDKGLDENRKHILIDPIVFTDKLNDEPIMQIKSITFRPVKLNDIIAANRSVGLKRGKVEYAIMISTITDMETLPQKVIDEKFIKIWGMLIFEKMAYDDLMQISRIKDNGGIQKTIETQCPECGDFLSLDIDTNHFFQSGLRKKY